MKKIKGRKLNQHLVNLIELLSDGQYHDGTTIGHLLDMTRSAVWKSIKKLKAHGIDIRSIKGKGYALLEPLKLLNKDYIIQSVTEAKERRLSSIFSTQIEEEDNKLCLSKLDLDIFEYIDSTNDYLKRYLNSAAFHLCLSEQQTKGKGRLSRNWYSPFGQNIYFSCLYLFYQDVSELAGLSLVVSLSIVKTLTFYHLSLPLLVKWPNDIICDNKKLCGSLVEMQAETNGISRAVIGIGININMLHDKEHPISQPWTSLRELSGNYIDRNALCALLIQNLISYLQRFEKQGLSSFLEEWNMIDGLKGHEVSLKSTHLQIEGQVKGINEDGHLLIKLKNGMIQAFSSGEIEKIRKQ